MKRLYGTRFDTNIAYSTIMYGHKNFSDEMREAFGDNVKAIWDVTDDSKLIFFVTTTASDYDAFEKSHRHLSRWIEFDYFNLNKIED